MKRTILIIDDERSVCAAIEELLKDTYEVIGPSPI